MYQEFEIKTSYKYLNEVIKSLKEPTCMLGGWAVFFHVNNNYKKAQGRPYLGSRDIDLGFHIVNDLKNSTLSQTITILEEELKFKPLSFRLMKEIHTETEEEIKEGEKVPAHFIFPMYIDLIVDNIPDNFRKIFGFNPIDEPLLKHVFENKGFTIIREFDKDLLLSNPELLLAMKINSLPNRDREHKRLKDICDIFALLWYSSIDFQKTNLSKYVSNKNIQKCLNTITQDEYEKATLQVGHSSEEIKQVLSLIEGAGKEI